jgi:NAD(P)-dependent dehydrogenase (short-subunit alcohol dehydrogenase family)
VNNAGIMIAKPISELSLEDWNTVISVNLTGIFLTSKYGAPYLREHQGSIVNIASTRALMSEPICHGPDYDWHGRVWKVRSFNSLG